MSIRVALPATAVAAAWGLNFVVMDWGLAGVPPFLFASIRFALVFFPAAVFVPRPEVAFRWVVGYGVLLGGCKFGMVYLALHLGMPPGLASLVLQLQVPATVAAFWLVAGERPRSRALVGLLVGVVGLGVVGVGRPAHVPAVGVLLIVGAALAWAAANALVKVSGCRAGLGLTVWSAGISTVPLALGSLLVEGPRAVAEAGFGWQAGASTAYTVVVSTLVGFGAWNRLLARYPAASVTPFALLVPVFGILGAALWAGEHPGALELLVGALLIGGAALAVLPSFSQATRRRAPARRTASRRSGARPAVGARLGDGPGVSASRGSPRW